MKFIQIDVVNFYPSITEELLMSAINWARQFLDITEQDVEIIIQSKKSILFDEGTPWTKKGRSNFDISQGSYDGAECAELVGLFILDQLNKIDRLSPGLYRDDCLAVTNASNRQCEKIKQKMCEIFKNYNLGTTSTANLKKVDFLDLTFDLEKETFQPYNKPGNVPQYVHKLSNHPPSIIKNIPESVNRRLSSISSNEQVFNAAAPQFQEAIKKSGYDYKLKFNPPSTEQSQKKKKKSRKRNVLWFNPPYNSAVKSNVGRKFLGLIDKCFPTGHPLRKVFNRNNVKVSYSTMPNMGQIIAGKNKKTLNKQPENEKICSCPSTKVCPLENKCLTKGLVYKASVTLRNKETKKQETKTYIGQTSTDFKQRLSTHKHSFKYPDKDQTSLSKYIWEHKSDENWNVTWKIVDRGRKFSPVSGSCQLCAKESFYILFKPEMAQLNKRSEIFSACPHKKTALLFKIKRGRKRKSPGN